MCGAKKQKNVCIAQHAIFMVVNIHSVITLDKGEENYIISNYKRAKR